MPIIYRKSAKGISEIETRAHRLPPRMRSALILVDGKRSDDDLRPLIQPHAGETLAALAEQGFIEALAPPPVPAPRPAQRPATAPPADFETRRRAAVRALNDQLGPRAETLAIKMERARSDNELRPLLATAAQLIANAQGRAAGEAYAARFAGL